MTDPIQTSLRADRGPVANAIAILCDAPALSDHVKVTGDSALTVEHTGIPYDLWGSGAQGLWLCALAMAYRGQQVSLYDVVSRLDSGNRAALRAALHALTR